MTESTETLGARIMRLRESRGLSRAELAVACVALGRRMARNDIWRYEAGIQDPGLRTFAALARACGSQAPARPSAPSRHGGWTWQTRSQRRANSGTA